MTAQTSRRQLLRLLAAAAAAFAAGCDSKPDEVAPGSGAPRGPCLPAPPAEWLVPSDPRVALPHLGGAPDTAQGWTIAVFCDTVIPGAHRDPEQAPGAIDVGAPAMFYDPALPALPLVGLLATFLDATANQVVTGASFGTLPPERRDEALEQALDLELMEFAVQLARLAYYSSAGAACHLGYPGANPGYVDDADFSFKTALATEITEDGNYP